MVRIDARSVTRVLPFLLLFFSLFNPSTSAANAPATDINTCPPPLIRLFHKLATASEEAYAPKPENLFTTPAGCVAIVRESGDNTLIIAFRGSMLTDRDPDRRPFSNLGGAVMRRNYRDWVTTNLKQTAGFLPRQYTEAADLVVEQIRLHPDAKKIYLTGHSKGGGAAEYAAVAAWFSPQLTERQKAALAVVTFNAAVVRERNWRRLCRVNPGRDFESLRNGDAPPTATVSMAGDPVSKIAAHERLPRVRRYSIESDENMHPLEQHGIDVILAELERRLDAAE